MRKIIDTSKQVTLTFFPETTEDEIVQNIYCILNTVKGTVPMYREFGLDNKFSHQPTPAAKAALAVAIAEAIAQFEPRAQVHKIDFNTDPNRPGRLLPILEVTFLAEGE